MNQPIFSAYVSGVEDVTTDFHFAISYFSILKRDAVPSYYSIVTFYSNQLLDAFTNRPNGKLYLLRNNSPFDHCNIDSVPFYVGPRSSSLSVSGSRQETNTSPTSFAVSTSEVTMEKQQVDGSLTLSLVPSLIVIRPSDTVVYRGVSYLVIASTTQAGGHTASRTLLLEAV